MSKMAQMALALTVMITALAPMSACDAVAGSAYDFDMTSIDGTDMPLAQWRGKAILVVNTASFCGYTGQYSGLQELWSRYEKDGLVVLGVPSNDFSQEPKAEGEIKSFCQGAFGVTFPLTEKVVVRGDDAHPLYAWLAKQAGAPGWNFHKYLIGRDGQVLRSFPTAMSPQSEELVGWIEKALQTGAKKPEAASH